MKRIARIVSVTVCVLFVLVSIAGFIAGGYFVELALNPSFDKSSVIDAEHNTVNYSSMTPLYDEGRAWFDETGYSSLYQQSFDGLTLHAYAVENSTVAGTWVIICHGYASTAYTMVGQAAMFHARGYNVLLPDARACGHSEGRYLGMGWPDRLDLLAWATQLNERYAPKNIVLYGISMGGAAVMMASGEKTLPGNVRAIVEDCGYSTVWDEFSYQLNELFGLPAFPLLNYASAITRIRAGYWVSEANAAAQVKKSITPTLFIHGANDTFVPAWMAETLYTAAGCEKELLVIPKAGHGEAGYTDETLYWNTIDTFLARYLI